MCLCLCGRGLHVKRDVIKCCGREHEAWEAMYRSSDGDERRRLCVGLEVL